MLTCRESNLEGSKLMADDRDQHDPHATRDQEEQAPASAQPGQSSPFLHEIRQIERQGVPESGAVNPGSPPRPVRSGDFHAGPLPPEGQGEER